jgi:urocanate hydratase
MKLELGQRITDKKKAKSIALLGNAAEVHWQILERGIVPDVVTDQTSAHDVLYGYIPLGLSIEEANELRKSNPSEYEKRAMDSMARHVEAMLEFQKRGAVVFDYGNNLRQRAKDNGVENAFDYPGLCSRLHSPAVLRRQRSVSLGRAVGR